MPYDQGKPITIVGYQIVQILTAATSNGYMAAGAWQGTIVSGMAEGADHFAMTGGVGTNSKTAFFPPGTGIPQRGDPNSHIDVYGACDAGMQQALVNILYTSP